MTNSTITIDDINKTIKDLGNPIINNPFMFCGLRVYEEPLPTPKLKLRENIQVTDEFRKEFDAWLLDMFGRQESLLGKDKCFMMETMGMVIVPHNMAGVITSTLA